VCVQCMTQVRQIIVSRERQRERERENFVKKFLEEHSSYIERDRYFTLRKLRERERVRYR